MEMTLEAFKTAAGMLWKALWALIFGYTISAGIQVLVTREQMAKTLGDRGPKKAGLASFFGFVSSSCSFAALAASRSVLVKGAHPLNALSFLIASTNLVIELGIVLLVLIGWEFLAGNFTMGVLMVVYAHLISYAFFPKKLAEQGKKNAQEHEQKESMQGQSDAVQKMSWKQKLASKEGWTAIAHRFFMEWKMVYKEILFGFTIAGFISVFVPDSFWNSLFIGGGSGESLSFLAVVENAAIAPIIAFFTFIGSMGNVPLAAMLWSKNSSFGGVMAFLGADLVAATVVWVHAKYYGWKYAGYLSVLLYFCMVAAGVTTHYIFAVFGILPEQRPSLSEMVAFKIDYTFWLNLVFLILGAILLSLHYRNREE